MELHEELTHAETEDRVAEELEPLVVRRARLVREARMGERLLEARNVAVTRQREDDRAEIRAGLPEDLVLRRAHAFRVLARVGRFVTSEGCPSWTLARDRAP